MRSLQRDDRPGGCYKALHSDQGPVYLADQDMPVSRWLQSWRQTTIANKATAIAGLVVAAATVIYAIVASSQLSELRDSNRINREALESVQRAFVTFSTAVDIVGVIDPKTEKVKEWDFRVPMENSGVTPTQGMLMHVDTYVSQDEMPEDFSYPDTGVTSKIRIVLGPKEKSGSTPVGAIKPEAMLGIKNRTEHLYLYGWATYRDIFKDTPLHVTKFCYEMTEFDPDPFTGQGWKGTFFVTTRHHNCTDEDCANER